MNEKNLNVSLKLFLSVCTILFLNVSLSAQCASQRLTIKFDPANICTGGLVAADFKNSLGAIIPVTNVSVRKPGGTEYYITAPANMALPFVSTGAIFTLPDTASEFEVRYMAGGNMCTSFLSIRDQTAPAVTVITNPTYIRCNALVNGKAPAPGNAIAAAGPGSNPNVTTHMPEPVSTNSGVFMSRVNWNTAGANRVVFANVTDCRNFRASYEDTDPVPVVVANTCSAIQIDRIWTFKDPSGFENTVIQNIIAISPQLILPATLNLSCVGNSDVTNAGLPSVDWNTNGTAEAGETIVSGENYCGSSATLIATPTVMPNGCQGSKMITRTWKVIRCGGAFTTETQIINVTDDRTPRIGIQYNNYPRTAFTQQVCIDGMTMTEFVYDLVRDLPNEPSAISAQAGDGNYVNIPGETYHSTIRILPLMDNGSCNRATLGNNLNRVRIGLFEDNCGSYPITVTSSAIVNGSGSILFDNSTSKTVSSVADYTINLTGLVIAATSGVDPYFILKATDACGNTTNIKVVVVIIDNLSPTPICNGSPVTLNNSGSALITAAAIANNSTDNCSVARRLVRRKTAGNSECWSDKLILSCNDVGSLIVETRIIDMMGNYNDCTVTINVQDGSGPTCPMMPDVTITCNHPNLSNIESFFTQPTAFDNCETPTVNATTPTLVLDCGRGNLLNNGSNIAARKSWTFTDRGGQSVTCTQTLRVNPVLGFRMTALRSINPACGAIIPTREQDLNEIRSNFKNLRRNLGGDGIANANYSNVAAPLTVPNNNPTFNAGDDFDELSCSAPAVFMPLDEVSYASNSCKIIKRMYEVVDLCPNTTTPCSEANTLDLGLISETTPNYQITDREVNPALGVCRIRWHRYITVTDIVPPVMAVIPPTTVCIADLAACTMDMPDIRLTASDQCNGSAITQTSYLFYSWEVFKADGTRIATGNGSGSGASNEYFIRATNNAALRNLPIGTYTITYTVIDDCSNPASGSTTLTIKDCKTPSMNGDSEFQTALASVVGSPGQGMSMVCVNELITGLSDNCTDIATLRANLRLVRAAGNTTYPTNIVGNNCIMFNCADAQIGVIPVRIWTRDNSGNTFFIIVDVLVQDPNLACISPLPQAIVNGTLKTETAQPVKNVTISASINGSITAERATDANGSFNMIIPQGKNYVFKANKQLTDDKYVGVSTADIARISSHALNIDKFISPYQSIAADVNRDNVIDIEDMVTMRNFVLRKIQSLPGGVWRFIDKAYIFRNPANPFSEDFPEVINITDAKANEVANFVAVKLGDANRNFTSNAAPMTVRSNQPLVLNIEDIDLIAGNEYAIPVTAKNFNATAFQGTFSIANATITNVKGGDLANYGDGNFALFGSEFTTSWNGKIANDVQVFTIHFVAHKSAKLSTLMSVGSALTPAIANDVQGNDVDIRLQFNSGTIKGGEFALYNAFPNPVTYETTINFVMPKDGAAKMTLYTVDGKVLTIKNIEAKAGLNNVIVAKSELNVSGIVYYRLETAEHSATKKMVVID
jgi:hypothetical protein